ncbi:MAG TPA: LPS-assembly protein LptD, partial [Hyphomicrobiaceae bacterium]|nr:LPS-assembly protein LptD [Hyphomicrobiaceae bacterium]
SRSGGYARFVAGQSFHLAGENPYTTPGSILIDGVAQPVFSANSGLGTDRSDYVIGAYLAPVDIFRFAGQVRLDEHDLSLQRADLYAVLRLGPVSAGVNYSLAAADPSVGLFGTQQDLYGTISLELTKNWSIAAYARYDLDDRFLLQDSIRVSYKDECFVLTASYTETFISNPTLDLKPDRAIMLTFELKHIGQFKYKSDALDHVFGENQTSIPK